MLLHRKTWVKVGSKISDGGKVGAGNSQRKEIARELLHLVYGVPNESSGTTPSGVPSAHNSKQAAFRAKPGVRRRLAQPKR
jgi:hypothetical protein